MWCRVWLVAALAVSSSEAFFFNFKGGSSSKGSSKRPPGKYPSSIPSFYGGGRVPPNNRPAGYNKPRPSGNYLPFRPPSSPVPKPVTTYGPPPKPHVSIRPTGVYGPPKVSASVWGGSGSVTTTPTTVKGAITASGGVWGNGVSTSENSYNGGWSLSVPNAITVESSTSSSGSFWGSAGNGGTSGGYPSYHSGSKVPGVHGIDSNGLSHHTHFHSHYHTSFKNGWSGVTLSTGVGGQIMPRTVTLQQQVATANYLPRGSTSKPGNGQASHKVVTFIKPAPPPTTTPSSSESSSVVNKQVKTPRLIEDDSDTSPTTTPTSSSSTVAAPPDQQNSASSLKPRKARSLTDALVSLHLGKFLSLAEDAGIQDVFKAKGGFTVFAFSDDAWSMLPANTRAFLTADVARLRDLLLHHVTPVQMTSGSFTDNKLVKSASSGGALLRINVYQLTAHQKKVVTVNGAVVQVSDDTAFNGVVHVLDSVLLRRAEADALTFISKDQCADLNFETVTRMFNKLDLSHVLKQDKAVTIFLPISSAFSIPASLSAEFGNNTIALQNTLLYHVVPGTYYSAGLRDGQWLPTLLDGQELQVQVVSDGFSRRVTTVSKQAQVIQSDIPVANGVVHVIDFILRPERNLQQCTLQ